MKSSDKIVLTTDTGDFMSDNSTETGTLSMNDAISLLSTPPEDNATEEQPEAEQPQQPETEALEASE